MKRGRAWAPLLAAMAVVVLTAGCGGGDDDHGGADSVAAVRPFSEMQKGEITFSADPARPDRVLAHVGTKEEMICAFVWGETEALGRMNNAQSMNGTGITDHDVGLPGAEPGKTYHYIVQGTAKDGTLYRSEMATFKSPAQAADASGSSPAGDNLALAGQVTAVSSEFDPSFGGANAIDDDLTSEWSSKGDGDKAFVTVDLGAAKHVGGLEFITRSMGDGTAITNTYQVVVDDKSTYGPFPAGTITDRHTQVVDFTGRVLRFQVVSTTGGNTGAIEVRAFAKPS